MLTRRHAQIVTFVYLLCSRLFLLAQPLPSGLVLPDRAVLLSSLLYITVLSTACMMVSDSSATSSAEIA